MLVVDIENTPNLIWAWDLWNVNAIDVEMYWYMLSFAYGWYDLRTNKVDKIEFISLFQDPDFEPDTPDDKYVVERLWDLLDTADIVIGQNSRSFDTKKFNARAIINGMSPPSPYRHIDTKVAAKEVGRFTSNSLKHLSRELGVTHKEENRGFPMWRECISGLPKAWREMESYNKADVKSTAELYTVLRPWMGNHHPNMGLYITSEGRVCTKCGNKEKEFGGKGFQNRGRRTTNASSYQSVYCNGCGGWSREFQREPQRDALTTVDLRP
jgi:hypothetical protein